MVDRLRRNRRVVITALVLLLVLGVGGSAWALTGTGNAAYRTAPVSRGGVVQTLTSTGSIAPVRSAALDFQVAGKVAKVLVKEGMKVRVGRRLAVLDRASLRSALRSARSTLTNARSQLVADETAQASVASSASSQPPTQASSPTPTTSPKSTTPPKTSSSPPPTGGTGSVNKALLAKIRQDQASLLGAQHQADTDLATATDALSAETTACAAELAGSDSSSDTTTCVAATQALLSDQHTVATDQKAVTKAETSLNDDLSAAVGSVTPASPGANQDAESSSDSASSVTTESAVDATAAVISNAADPRNTPAASSSSPESTSAASNGGGSTVTASTLAGDQATIDSDRASVASARADLAQATLRAPITGKIAALTIAKGDAASGTSDSSSPAVKIVGSRQAKVTIDVTPAQVGRLKTGMAATVTPDGTSTPLQGTVSLLGQATTDSSTGDITYPVTISLTARPTNLVLGADAQVAVTLSQLSNVIVVPTSAVHHNGTLIYVQTLTNGTLKRVTVTIGAVGAAVTQITSGLTVGQHVVLANLNAAVPSSSTNLTNRSGLGGSLGGNGFTGRAPSLSGGFQAPPGGASFGGG